MAKGTKKEQHDHGCTDEQLASFLTAYRKWYKEYTQAHAADGPDDEIGSSDPPIPPPPPPGPRP
jgi:hypothetical protein